MNTLVRFLTVFVLISLLAACGGGKAPEAPPPPQVEVATPLQREVTDWDDYTGRFEATQDAEVRPRVNGVVTAIHFRDGQDVRQGQPLFTIDPRPYRAALAQAQAQAARAQAALTNAQQVTARSNALARCLSTVSMATFAAVLSEYWLTSRRTSDSVTTWSVVSRESERTLFATTVVGSSVLRSPAQICRTASPTTYIL